LTRRLVQPMVLNAGPPPPCRLPLTSIAAELRVRLARLVVAHTDVASALVDYQALAASTELGALVEAARGLGDGRPEELETAEAEIAFWVNLYNALALHAVVALDIRTGVGEVHEFFRRPGYVVGGDVFSLADIEHGVLRQNRVARNVPAPALAPGDPRLRWVARRFDPRIHFALTCATRSCPPIRAFDAEHLDAQLDQAATAFVTEDLEIDAVAGTITLSRIFYWYEADFGDLIAFLLPYLEPGPGRAWLTRHGRDATIAYRPYAWALNAMSR
jgi:hypothetical protein